MNPTELTKGKGRLTAENLDLRLQLEETRERLAAICADRDSNPPGFQDERRRIDPFDNQRNVAILHQHLDVCQALASSMPWRAVNLVSRPFRQAIENPVDTLANTEITDKSDPAAIRRHLDQTSEFMARVWGSKRWRILQNVRRVFGRQW
ncbi:MAG: hypothetical protein P8127_15235 [Acidobacteriota bacterium]